MALRFHRLRIADIRRETSDSAVLSFDVPDGVQDEFAFRPGQHVSLQTELGGRARRRTYSIASGPNDPLTVGIRLQPHGIFSNFAAQLTAGRHLDVMTPSGRFFWSGEKRLILLAAGSGITPIISIAAHALADGADVSLLYGNRSANSAMFLDRLAELKNRDMPRFRIFHVMSREDSVSPLMRGRLDGARIERLTELGIIDPASCDGAFICGPGDMLAEAEAALSHVGLDPARIHAERFAPAPRAHAPAQASADPAEDGPEINAILDGARKRFTFHPDDGSVIAAGLRQGHVLPYSCRGGMCCTCRCKVLEGRFEMAANYSLEPWEIEDGYTLACQTRPVSKRIVLDFDAA